MAGSRIQAAIFESGKSPTTKFCRQVELDMTDRYACDAGLQKGLVCDRMEERFKSSTPEYKFANYIDVDRQLGHYINKYMCSSRCPCEDLDVKSEWQSMGDLPLKQQFGRDIEKTPFDFADKNSIDTFRQCLEKAKTYKGKDAVFKRFKEIVSQQQYKESAEFVSVVEATFECSGFCTTNLFL